ncbi:MAG: molybdenum cofactor guanylyltransferase [Bacteroidia bacterium]
MLKGLVLAGGRSTRMGKDKGRIQLHTLPLREHIFHLMKAAGLDSVYISCRADQAAGLGDYPVIVDHYPGTGPLGAILSAFETDENSAWLVLACDMPMLSAQTIRQLIQQRKPHLPATVFSDETGYIQPLAAIWEPAIIPTIREVFFYHNQSPRSVLLQSDIHLIVPEEPSDLTSFNKPEELNQISVQFPSEKSKS